MIPALYLSALIVHSYNIDYMITTEYNDLRLRRRVYLVESRLR